MSEPTQPPTPVADHTAKDRRTGRLLIGSGIANLTSFAVIAVLLLVIAQLTGANTALVNALTQQRDQFVACKDKPASARGCTTPVAAEPEVIAKQGKRGPAGLSGDIGKQGPQGPQGPEGPTGKPGKAGPPPGCALLSTACVGATGGQGLQGVAGKNGKDGADGKNGADGLPGRDGADGKNGADGSPGIPGTPGLNGYSVKDMDCVGDGPESRWTIYLSNDTVIDAEGPCRIGPDLP